MITDVRVDDCLIQVKYTGSDEWVTVGDIGDCSSVVAAGAAAAAAQATADEALALAKAIGQPGAVPGGDIPLPAGECRTIEVTVFGHSAYIVPFRVSPGDTVQVVNYSGAWAYENSYSALWYGWNGGIFLLGTVNEFEDTSTATGVYSTRRVQTLIGRYGTNFLDLSNGLQTTPGPIITVPSGSEFPLILQMNDTDLSDNQGSILLEIQVCSGAWCIIFDFTISDYGFTISAGSYVGGVGFQTGYYVDSGNGYRTVDITYTLPAGTYEVTGLDMTYDTSLGVMSPPAVDFAWTVSGAPGNRFASQTPINGTDRHLANLSLTVTPGTTIGFDAYGGYRDANPADPGGQATLKSLTMRGRGSPPAIGVACP